MHKIYYKILIKYINNENSGYKVAQARTTA